MNIPEFKVSKDKQFVASIIYVGKHDLPDTPFRYDIISVESGKLVHWGYSDSRSKCNNNISAYFRRHALKSDSFTIYT